jgi:hypothetical protein
MIQNEVDALTLQYFVNNKFEKSIAPDSEKTGLVVTSAERKFYKKRILQLMKDMFKKKGPNDSLQSSFDSFVFSSISYFKFADASEVLQEEYGDVDTNDQTLVDPDIDVSTADEGIFNIPPSKATLDTFVTTKTVTMNEKIIPTTKPINITNDKYKTKGVKKKKKKENVQDIYGKKQSEEKPPTEVRKTQ